MSLAAEQITADIGSVGTEYDFLARSHRYDDLGTFGQAQHDPVLAYRVREQAAVGGDDVELAVVREAEVVDPGGRGVEQP